MLRFSSLQWRLGPDGSAVVSGITSGPGSNPTPTGGSVPQTPPGANTLTNGTVTTAGATQNPTINPFVDRNQTQIDPVSESATNPMSAAVPRAKTGGGADAGVLDPSSNSVTESQGTHNSSPSQGLGTALIATGIGAFLAFCVLVGLLIWFCRQRKLRGETLWLEIRFAPKVAEDSKSDYAVNLGDKASSFRPASSLSSASGTVYVGKASKFTSLHSEVRTLKTTAPPSGLSSPRESLFVLPITNTNSVNTFVSVANTVDERGQRYSTGMSMMSDVLPSDPIQSDALAAVNSSELNSRRTSTVDSVSAQSGNEK
ncbi:hypothetical protein HK102_002126 [Quaeritorhiza haematococci]|nr:hypothetical protein HK102_002126 [Quaeritorhiza haematococci]